MAIRRVLIGYYADKDPLAVGLLRVLDEVVRRKWFACGLFQNRGKTNSAIKTVPTEGPNFAKPIPQKPK